MGLIAPLFLAGVLAVALPIWLHRLETEAANRERFGSAMLLDPTEQRVHVRRAIKYRWLLALRILLLLLLAFAFAKPFLTRVTPETAPAARTHLIAVDTSLSMNERGAVDAAKTRARDVIRALPVDDAIVFIDGVTPETGGHDPVGDRATLDNRVTNLSPGVARLEFGRLMHAIDERLRDLDDPATVHLISDFQASAVPNRFSDLIPARAFDLSLYPVTREPRPNWSVDTVRRAGDGLAVDIRGHGTAKREIGVTITVNDEKRYEGSAEISTGGEITVSGVEFESGDNRVRALLEIDDTLEADNSYYHVVDNRPPDPVPFLTDNANGLPLTYIRAAFEAAGGDYRLEPLVAGEYDPRVLGRYRWLIVDDIGRLDALTAGALTGFINAGGNVLAFVSDRLAGADQLPLTGNRIKPATPGPRSGPFIAVADVDNTHPVLMNTDGWHDVHLARYVSLAPEPDDRMLITLESGEPFLFERRIGAGRVLVLTSGLDNRWNDLPTRAVFVSFMIEAAAGLSGVERTQRQYTVGDALPLSLTDGGSGQVVDPLGKNLLSLGETRRAQRIALDVPGFYEVYTPQGEFLIAVNTDPRESDTTPMSQDALERWQASVAGGETVEADSTGATAATAEAPRIPLWPWLLALLGLAVIGESLMANHYLGAGVRQ